MRLRVIAAISSMLIASAALTQKTLYPRDIGDEHPLRNQVSDLPLAQRNQLLKALSPSIAKWKGHLDLDSTEREEESSAVKQKLLWEEFKTPNGTLTFVQGWDVEGCGGVGNCMLFVLGPSGKVILDNLSGKEFSILPSLHHGLPDILVGGHMSASQTNQTWYYYNGEKYFAAKCAVDTYGMPYTDNKRHRVFGACEAP